MTWENIEIREKINGEMQTFQHPVDKAVLELCTEMELRTDPQKKNRDVIVAVTGQRGIGKSNTVNTFGYAFGHDFSLHTHVLYDPAVDKLHDFVYNMPSQSFMNVDEAIRIAYRRQAMTSKNISLNELIGVCRKQNKVSMFSIPDFFQLDSDVQKSILLWVYLPDYTKNGVRRGIVSMADNRLGRDTWNLKMLQKEADKLPEKPWGSDVNSELDMLRRWPNYCFEFEIKRLPPPIDALYDYLSKSMVPKLAVEKKSEFQYANNKRLKTYQSALIMTVKSMYATGNWTLANIASITGLTIQSIDRYVNAQKVEDVLEEKVEDAKVNVS